MKPQQGVECGSWVESPYESALSTSILLDEQLNRRHMTVMRVSGSCRQFLCETVSRLGVATTTHMLKGLRLEAPENPADREAGPKRQRARDGHWRGQARREHDPLQGL